jgi:hypothetical protein
MSHKLLFGQNNMKLTNALLRKIQSSLKTGGTHTRAVRKVTGHFEYLETWSRSLDVTWQPVTGDFTAHT